ncbi:MAG: antibiotic biosynthesis monooxygenase [Salegentibacter sp.]|uniref:Quinol monooxygenase YgiN n=1 Tax=Salegentibacter flavus TaxID=287099 RepID=A0A1I4ZDX3_9FLAO|nr:MULTISPECIES: antibiotic biosynthesis monooxygenase [Salegentibacter]MDR9456806.1 antibiotic biosynthesis monooxygenase [Salegentibacter sp.]SFN48456.1 Quinol monooxygenase YgiN [Salegentibacter flavus]
MKKNILLLFISLIVLGFTSCNKEEGEEVIVLVKYKTLPNKNIDALASMERLIENVEKEDHFVQIKLHVDKNDNSNIMLYEVWNDEDYYKNEHMETEHLKQFKTESQAFLAGPPEISYWKEHSVYE